MKRLLPLLLVLSLAACGRPATPDLPPLATLAPSSTVPPTATARPKPTQPPPASATSTRPASRGTATPTALAGGPGRQLLAYLRDGQLWVVEVTHGAAGAPIQRTRSGIDDQVTDLDWSPSGALIAYTSLAQGEPHLFVAPATGAATAVDLGAGYSPAWAPDSQHLAFERDGNLWLTPAAAAAPKPLTALPDWAWGQAAFTPDAAALIVTENARLNLGAQGNTFFTLKQLTLDGSGAITPLASATQFDGGRLPQDMRFSPDGRLIAFSTSFHVNACASPGTVYVTDARGGNRRELFSAQLAALQRPQSEIYLTSYAYAWSPASDALAIAGVVRDCTDLSGKLLGSQISVVGLDLAERLTIAGSFASLSYSRAGEWLAAEQFADEQGSAGQVHIFSAQTGQRVLDLGPGSRPAFQP